jgi:hypothetical protein
VVTGAITNAEMSIRSSIGFFLFVPPDENVRALNDCGFVVEAQEDVTANEAETSARWITARRERRESLIRIEGEETYEGTQKFFEAVHALSSSRRLSRVIYLARRL